MSEAWREALQAHMDDSVAHSRARHQQTNDWIERFQKPVIEDVVDLQERMSIQEMWRQRILGGLSVLSLAVGGGILGLVYEIVRK
jgi:hypothetical protein